MKKFFKQAVCTLLMVIMLFEMLPALGIVKEPVAEADYAEVEETEAEGYSFDADSTVYTYEYVEKVIAEIWNQAGNRYWNGNTASDRNNQSAMKKAADRGEYKYATTEKACSIPAGKEHLKKYGCDSNAFYTSDKDGKYSGRNAQCYGFGVWVDYCIFKQIPQSNWKKHESIPKGYELKPGDWLRVNGSGIGTHTVVVWKNDGKNVTVIECNWGGKCKINKRVVALSKLEAQINENGSKTYFYESPAVKCDHKGLLNSNGDCTRCKAHVHAYDPLGYCVKDKHDAYADTRKELQGTVVPIKGEYFTVYTRPYPTADKLQSFGITLGSIFNGTLKTDAKIKSAQIVSRGKNHFENVWFEVKIPNESKTYYVSESDVKSTISTSISASGVKYPIDKFAGDSLEHTKGTISSAYYKLNSVKAQVIKVDKDKTTVKYSAEKPNINAITFDLMTFDSKIGFSKLDAGTYKYVITAIDEIDGKRTFNYDFIINKTSGQPKYSISFNANNGQGAPANVQVTAKSALNLSTVAKPTRVGYTFKGWAETASAASAKYTTTITPTKSMTLYAVWEQIGPPSAPTMSNDTKDIGTERTVTVNWNAVANAVSYVATAKDGNGNIIDEKPTKGTTTAMMFKDVGTYYITVRAINALGKESTESSSKVTVNVHPDSTVIFKNYDDSEWGRATVKYNESVMQTNIPTRTGYTFKRWDKSFLNVKEDRVISPVFEPIQYKVTFYDNDGNVCGTPQMVTYDEDTPGSATPPEISVPIGYSFVGWDTDAYQSVTSNVEVHPTIVWADEDIPIQTTVNEVTEAGEGYWVEYNIRNMVDASRIGRVVVVMKSQFGKFLTRTESGAFYLAASSSINTNLSSYTGTIYVPMAEALKDDFSVVEVYVVDNYSSMKPISMPATKIVLPDNYEWTPWVSEAELADYDCDISTRESKTQYRSAKREEYTTTASTYLDWTKTGRTVTSYTPWVAETKWRDEVIANGELIQRKDKKDVVTSPARTEYRYGYWVNSNGRHSYNDVSSYKPFDYTYKYTAWSTTRYTMGSTKYKNYERGADRHYYTYNTSNKMYYWNWYYKPGTDSSNNANRYFFEESRTVAAQKKTQYLYETRTKIIKNIFEHWTAYGLWTDTPITADTNTKVETRTLYRAKLNMAPQESKYHYSGAVGEAAAGKQAIFTVYRVDEASDYSNEYIQQVTLGAGGSYDVYFNTLDEISIETGDFTCVLTIEGSENPLYVDTIRAPRRQYTVTFVDELDDTQIGEVQIVEEGDAVTAPDSVPEHEGYFFLGWEYGLTNIRDDMIIHARYVEKEYVVVFLDWINGTVDMVTGVRTGTQLDAPEVETPEGYNFIGWKTPDGLSIDKVTDNMIVTAEYEPIMYTVSFCDVNGEELDTITVQHGQLPENPIDENELWDYDNDAEYEEEPGELEGYESGIELYAEPDDGSEEEEEGYYGDYGTSALDDINEALSIPEGMYFVGWDEDAYIPTTNNLILMPRFEYYETASEAEYSLEPGIYGGPQTLELSCSDENAAISYIISTGNEDENAQEELEYTAPIEITETCTVEVMTFVEGMNTATVVLEYVIVPESAVPAAPAKPELSADAESVTISWNAVTGADGYVVYKSNDAGDEERFITETTSYTDDNLEPLGRYSYSVASYVIYDKENNGLYVESVDSSEAEDLFFFGAYTPIDSIEIDVPDTLYVGTIEQLEAEVLPTDAYEPNVIWGIESDTDSAYITEDGILVATAAGTATISAYANDGSDVVASKTVTIEVPGTDDVTLTIDSVELKTVNGRQADVSVSVSENSLASTVQFTLLYDADKLEVVECKAGTALEGIGDFDINANKPGEIHFVKDGLASITRGGSIMDITFAAKDGVNGDVLLTIPTSSDEYEFIFMDGNLTPLNVAQFNGVLSVKSVRIGDVNLDGKVNVIDANLVRRHAVQLITLTDEQFAAADVNGDGKVNVIDASLIRRYVVNIITVFPAEQANNG